MKTDLSDAKAVHAVLSGRHDVFAALVERHLSTMVGIAFVHTANRADAEDAVQDSFVEAYRCLDTLREPGKFGPWLATIVRRMAARTVASRARHAKIARESAPRAEFSQPDPAREELNAMVRERLAGLDEHHREAVILHYFVGKSTREAAEFLGISRDALKKRLQRGREALGEALLREAGDAFQTDEDPKQGTRKIMGIIGGIGIPAARDSAAASGVVSVFSRLSLPAAKVVAAIGVTCMLVAVVWNWRPERAAEDTVAASSSAQTVPQSEPEQALGDRTADEAIQNVTTMKATDSGEQARGDSLLVCEVVEADGTPVAGAEVFLERRFSPGSMVANEDRVQRQGRTNDKGEVFFDRLPKATYVVRARTDRSMGFSRARVRQYLRERIVLEPAGTLVGHVQDAVGNGIAGAALLVHFKPRSRPVWSGLAGTEMGRTDSDGGFRVFLPLKYEWRFRVRADGYASLDTGPVSMEQEEVFVLDEGSQIVGRVIHAHTGEPLADVEVALISDKVSQDRYRIVTDASGRFRFYGLRDGEYGIELNHPKLAVSSPDRIAVGGEEDGAEAKILAEPGAVIVGQVYDEDSGDGVADVEVVVRTGRIWGNHVAKTNTDAFGVYRVEGLPQGPSSILVGTAPGFEQWSEIDVRRVASELGQEHGPVDFALTNLVNRSASIQGTVMSANGRPLPGAFIAARVVDARMDDVMTRADGNGRYTVTGLPITRDLRLWAFLPGWSSAEKGPLTLASEGLAGVDLTVHPTGSISGKVKTTSGRPWDVPDTYIDLLNWNQYPGRFMRSARAIHEGGIFRIPDVPAGRHGLDVDLPLYRYQKGTGFMEPQETVDVGPGEHVTGVVLEIDDDTYNRQVANQKTANTRQKVAPDRRQPQKWRVEGQVVDSRTGSPVVEFSVAANPSGGYRQINDEQGRLTLTNLRKTVARVTVMARGYSPQTKPVWREQAQDGVASVEIGLAPGPIVEGRVVDTGGSPVAGATIYPEEVPSVGSREMGLPHIRTSSADGSFRLDILNAKPQRIYADHPGYALGWVEITPAPGRPISATITLGHGGRIEGVLTDAGTPAPDATIRYRLEGFQQRQPMVKTDAEGRYAIENLLPGAVVVTAWPPNADLARNSTRYVKQEVWVEEGKTTRVDFVFPRRTSRIEGRITVQGEAPTSANLRVALRREMATERTSAQVDDSGFYETQPLASGEVTLFVTARNSASTVFSREIVLALGDGEVVTEDIDFAGNSVITGTVSGLEEEVVWVNALPGEIPLPDTPFKNSTEYWIGAVARAYVSDGVYRLDGLPAGTYTLRATWTGVDSAGEYTPGVASKIVTVGDDEEVMVDFDLH